MVESGALKSRGYSLLEAIIASFLLVFTFFLVSRLFQTGLQYSTRVETRLTAVTVAESRMARIREWADQSITWTTIPSEPQEENYPGYQVAVRRQPLDVGALFSPCSATELGFPEPREMTNIARKVIVSVTPPQGPVYHLTGMVTLGEHSWWPGGRVEISGNIPASVGPSDVLELSAKAFDSRGEIKDIFFHWTVDPVFGLAGVGSVEPTMAEVRTTRRDGKTAEFRNRVPRRDGAPMPQDGYCTVAAYCRYQGVWRVGRTPALELRK